MNLFLLFLMAFSGSFIYIGSMIGLKLKNNNRFINFNNSVILGYLCSLIILEILPKSYINLSSEVGIIRTLLSIILLSLIGIILLKIIDLFIPFHNSNRKTNNFYHIGLISTITILSYCLINGINLYLTFRELKNILVLFLLIGIGNIPFGIMISTLLSPRLINKKIFNISLISSLSIFIGGLIAFILGNISNLVKGVMFSLLLGIIIYFITYELLKIIINIKNRRIFITGLIIGILLVITIFILKLNM